MTYFECLLLLNVKIREPHYCNFFACLKDYSCRFLNLVICSFRTESFMFFCSLNTENIYYNPYKLQTHKKSATTHFSRLAEVSLNWVTLKYCS